MESDIITLIDYVILFDCQMKMVRRSAGAVEISLGGKRRDVLLTGKARWFDCAAERRTLNVECGTLTRGAVRSLVMERRGASG
jgi:hypothetical protein